jgi:hypothetical protein
MSMRRVLIGAAVAGLTSLAIVGIPAGSALAAKCPTGCHPVWFTGYGATQAAAKSAVDQIIAGNGCVLYGIDNFFVNGSGWGDKHEGLCA